MRAELTRALTLAAAAFSITAGTASIASAEKENPTLGTPDFTCARAKSPLYYKKHVNDHVNVKIITDYTALNVRMNMKPQKAVVAVEDAAGKVDVFPAMIAQRGKSRRSYCAAPPLRLIFVDAKIRESAEKTLVMMGIQPDAADYLKRYYDLYSTIQVADTGEGSGTGIFSKLGDDVKLVTHCGDAPGWGALGGPTEEAQNQRVLAEYYLYEMLGLLEMTVETVRLSHLIYLDQDGKPVYSPNDGQGNPVDYKLGFFREPPRSIAKRCGLETKQPAGVGMAIDDAVSAFQVKAVNTFAINSDYGLYGHNMNIFWDKNGKRYFGPYDYDLSGVIRPGPGGFYAGAIENSIGYEKKELLVPTIKRFLKAKQGMQSILDQTLLSVEQKKKFEAWLNSYMDQLEALMKKHEPLPQ